MSNNVKNVLSECLRSKYFAFIYPYLQYGIDFWGTTSDKYLHNMLILQKTANRQIAFANHHNHCAPFAKQLGIPFVNDIYKLSVCIFMFKVFNNVYPSSLTAYNSNFQLHVCNSDYVKYSIANQGAVSWNSIFVASKLCSSLHNFKCIVKCDLFADYI